MAMARPHSLLGIWLSVLLVDSILASGPELEFVNLQEECSASQSNVVGSLETVSFRALSKRANYNYFGGREPQNFTNVISDPSGDSVIVGTRNYILHIHHDMYNRLKVLATNANGNQVASCKENGIPGEECHNYNMVLLSSKDTANPCYLECGTGAVQPSCNWRNFTTGEIVQKAMPSPPMICPYRPRESTSVLIDDDTVFAGTFSILEEAMISRSNSNPPLTSLQDTLWLDKPRFISSFEHGDYVYMVLQEIAQEVPSEPTIFSRIVRVCKDDKGVNGVFRSFLKARIVCENGIGQHPDTFAFDLITSVFLANGTLLDANEVELLLYASFQLPPGAPKGSAVCAYRMSDIEDLFEKSPFYYSGRSNIWHEKERAAVDSCKKTAVPQESMKYLYLRDKLDAQSVIMLERIGISSICVQRIDTFDVFYLGTDGGEIFKMTRFDSRPLSLQRIEPAARYKSLVIDRVKLANRSIDKLLLLPQKAAVLVMTNNDVQWYTVLSCFFRRRSCSSCVQARDPYCGWCVDPHEENAGRCLHKINCQKQWDKAKKPMKYFQEVQHGDQRICGPAVEVVSLGRRDSVFVDDNLATNLTLSVRHATKVTWRRGINRDLHTVRGDRFSFHYDRDNGKASLQISPAVPNDKGWYTVIAQNNISRAEGTIKLVVTSKAQIIGQPKSVAVAPGSSAVFECRLKKRSGEGTTVAWLYCLDKGTKPYCKDLDMQVLVPRGNILLARDNSLVFLSAQQKDVGKYRCEVRDDITYVQSDVARLDIVEVPRLLEITADVVVPLLSPGDNQSVNLHCAVSCPYGVVYPLQWSFNNRPVLPIGVTNTTGSKCRSVLHLPPPITAGVYSCQLASTMSSPDQCPPGGHSSTVYYVSTHTAVAENHMQVAIEVPPPGGPRVRSTVSCPAKKIPHSWSIRWATVPSLELQGDELPSPFFITKYGDLRVSDVRHLSNTTTLKCWLDAHDPYFVQLNRI